VSLVRSPTSWKPSGPSAAVSRLLASRPRITSSVNSSMPQLVWWMTNHSLVPRSLWEMTQRSDRVITGPSAPRLRMDVARRPRLVPRTWPGSRAGHPWQVRMAKPRAGGRARSAFAPNEPGVLLIGVEHFFANGHHSSPGSSVSCGFAAGRSKAPLCIVPHFRRDYGIYRAAVRGVRLARTGAGGGDRRRTLYAASKCRLAAPTFGPGVKTDRGRGEQERESAIAAATSEGADAFGDHQPGKIGR